MRSSPMATWCASCKRHLPDLELIQKTFGGGVEVVAMEYEPELRLGVPTRLFEGDYDREFGVLPDGEHFVMVGGSGVDAEIVVVQNFSEELKRVSPAG